MWNRHEFGQANSLLRGKMFVDIRCSHNVEFPLAHVEWIDRSFIPMLKQAKYVNMRLSSLFMRIGFCF